MIELEGPPGVAFRQVQRGDEDAIFQICQDWNHDGRTFTRSAAELAVDKYVRDMDLEPGDHPCTADSSYREALIAHMPNGDPLALIVYTVRGANDPKNWPLAVNALYTEGFALNPAYRGQGRSTALLNTLIRSAFEDTGVDVLIHDLIPSPQMLAHKADREYSESTERSTRRGPRDRVVYTKADHLARMAARPDEAAQRHIFQMS